MKVSVEKKTRAEPDQPISTYSALWIRGEDDLLPVGYTSLANNAEILRCVYKIADLVSDMTIMLMKNGSSGDIRVRDELAKKIDINPCSLTNRKNFIFKIVVDMCIYGNSVVFPVIDRSGFISDLTPFYAGSCNFSSAADGYRINCGGRSYAPDEVLHFALYPHPEQYWRGQGIRPLLDDTIEGLAQANATKKGFLKSKWKPSLVIAVNGDIEQLQDAKMRANILGSYRDDTERGEPWLIPSGEIDVKTIHPLTLKDLAIQESITLDKQVVASAIGIPAFLVGVGKFDVDEYNNFISTTIMSFARIIEQELTKKIIYAGDRYFKLNSKSLMQYSLSDKINFAKEMVGAGAFSRNEMRCEFDYSPVDEPAMNEYNVLENYIPVSRLGDQKKLNGGTSSDE